MYAMSPGQHIIIDCIIIIIIITIIIIIFKEYKIMILLITNFLKPLVTLFFM
jgi:hypothetical protein